MIDISPREVQKVLFWANDISELSKERPLATEITIPYVPPLFREHVAIELKKAHKLAVSSWGPMSTGTSLTHPGPTQTLRLHKIIDISIVDDSDEDPPEDMFPMLVAFFCIMTIISISIWIGNI